MGWGWTGAIGLPENDGTECRRLTRCTTRSRVSRAALPSFERALTGKARHSTRNHDTLALVGTLVGFIADRIRTDPHRQFAARALPVVVLYQQRGAPATAARARSSGWQSMNPRPRLTGIQVSILRHLRTTGEPGLLVGGASITRLAMFHEHQTVGIRTRTNVIAVLERNGFIVRVDNTRFSITPKGVSSLTFCRGRS